MNPRPPSRPRRRAGGVKRFFHRYVWVGPLLGFLVGTVLGTGALWKYFEYRQKERATVLDQLKIEKDIYQRLQDLQNEALTEIGKYQLLRDGIAKTTNVAFARSELNLCVQKTLGMIMQYNRMEFKLAGLERRAPKFFVLPLPPLPPSPPVGLRLVASTNEIASLPPAPVDFLTLQAEKNFQALRKELGLK